MDFFPHRASRTNIASAISASKTDTATYMANNAGTTVNLATTALNSSGNGGTSGTSFLTAGVQGAQGSLGLKGTRGKNIYLLAATRSPSYPGTPCSAISIWQADGAGGCYLSLLGTYYSTVAEVDWTIGSPIYSDSGCNTLITPSTYINVTERYFTVSSGLINSTPSSCST